MAEISPGVVKLLPAMLPVTLSVDTTLPLKLRPTAFRLPAVALPLTLKLVPVAAPMLGVVKFAPALTMILPDPSNAVVFSSTLALNCDPIRLRPAAVLAVYEPAPENCTNTMSVVPTTTGAFVLHTHPVSPLIVPYSTKVNALGISLAWLKSVALVST